MRIARLYGPVIARIFMGALFLASGISKATGFEGTVGWAASAGMPMAEVAIAIAIILEVLGGLSLILGYKIRHGAEALIVYTIVATAFFHMDFSDPMEIIAFQKNLAIIGGLIYMMVYGAGPYSMDNKPSTDA